MTTYRSVQRIIHASPTLEGAGVHLKRAFGFHEPHVFDPFLLLDDFRGEKPEDYIAGFPWHPHRGIETITYVIEGSVEHMDSVGNSGAIRPGDVQWMTAGNGILHQEMPKPNPEGRMGGFQLWANLPASHKMMDPRYREVLSPTIPEVSLDGGAVVRVIAGVFNGVRGPVADIVIDPFYLDVMLPPGAVFTCPTPGGHTVFSYIYAGSGNFAPTPSAVEVEPGNYFDLPLDPLPHNTSLVLFGPGEAVRIRAAEQETLRFLLIAGRPLHEPIAWYGPIVMNTQAELTQAFKELQAGTFIKTGKKKQ
ncbi:pirin-related protein [Longilinea arvoryzae]|uniref:Pirin-related protein n=1 Tax=Longilinea arvoryzae TaxID=360412 RepID=A0A0K8MXK7_9CHLR|nr:pirin family protein [Longilinea arvoryzae]GAP15979.1 pirin-related protein [Longilinea arvoryzae]